MKIESWYKENFELHLKGRYVTLQHIFPLMDMYKNRYEISVPGVSELGMDIPLIKIGDGSRIVLGWSQMHGNESTTTKALFDFLKFISQKDAYQKEIAQFFQNYTFYIFPILNPDGAKLYTRENANGIDLNRDAQSLSQKESKCLRKIFEELNPELCLNLHDQRSIYGFKDGKPATLSFLAPAADKKRTITNARKVAMGMIAKMNRFLEGYIPGQVGRYDDSFNEACVGDAFQKASVPTILFEAGHYKEDYQREKSREFIFYSLLALFDIVGEKNGSTNYMNYFDIPENQKNYNDFILRNVRVKNEEKPISIAIQYAEILNNEKILLIPFIDSIGHLNMKIGHKEIDGNGAIVLTDFQESVTVGSKISKIVDKDDNLTIYFQ